jgi:hypothetical protein
MLFLLACASPDDTPLRPKAGRDRPDARGGEGVAEDTGDPPRDSGAAVSEDAATVTLVSEASCTNPCSFSARFTGAVATVRYDADGYELATVDATTPDITYTFQQLGDRDVRVTALDATGAELASDHLVVTVTEIDDGARGAWLWYIEGVGMSHTELAERLVSLSIDRVYVKVADGSADCSAWPELCDTSVPAAYRAAGVEPWAWAYVYPGSATSQAGALGRAATTGYAGYVLDIEVEFDGQSATLTDTMEAFAEARADAVADGATGFGLRATTWGNPEDHGMRVDIIDRYVDAHMPQTYVEVWGASYMRDAADWVQVGTCEYRSLGATRPIHHIVSTETGDITPTQIEAFLGASGPETSVWRVPGDGTPTSIWDDWAAVDWSPATYDEPDCP